MRRLALPKMTSSDLYLACVSGVGSIPLQTAYMTDLPNVETEVRNYFAQAQNEQLCNLRQTISPRGTDPVVVGALTKNQLNKLYTNYMVDENKPARTMYDTILVSANDKCPFCGGIGHPRTLDHYLPKANFPQYSVLPANLVPCCRDCNTEKSSAVAPTLGEQVLHPYLDNKRFFTEQWISASVCHSDPVALNFFVLPPKHWSPKDQQRVDSHFKDYGLAKRFGIEAGRELAILVHLRSKTLKNMSEQCFKEYLADVVNSGTLKMNDWKRVMYQALVNDHRFCSYSF